MPQIKLFENERISDGKLHITENLNVKPAISNKEGISQIAVTEAKGDGKKLVLKPRIEAIHAGRTRNGNIYPSDKLKGDFKLKSGVYSFLYPYPKPMLKNHDHESEPTGRIRNAQFITDSRTNRDAILIMPEVTDPDTIEKVLDGRYMTVSIGATTDAAMCNICGTDILKDGWCGHERGETYDGVECGWIVGNLYFDECSWVNVPADSEAMIIDSGEPVMMEAYAQVGEKYYNLGEGNVELKESAAKILGLYTDESEGGMDVNKPANPADIVLDEGVVDTEPAAESTEPVEPEGTAEETPVEEGIQEEPKEAEAEDMDALIAEKDAVIAEHLSTIEAKDAKIAELEEALSTSESQAQALTEEVAALKADKFKALAERVIDYKKALGKPIGESREEAVEEHLARSEESLMDSLADLMREFETRSINPVVTNPAIGAVTGENNSEIVGDDGIVKEKVKESLTDAEVLRKLFKGQYK